MQLYNKTRSSKFITRTKLAIKIILPILLIFLIIYFIGKIDMPSPKKLIKINVPNEKIEIVK